MIQLSQLKSQQVALWGFGVEGKATAQYLTDHDINFTVLCQLKEADDRYHCLTQTVDAKLLSQFDVVIKSPGISPYNEVYQTANTHFSSATALWFANEYQFCEQKPQVIAITGTKGKSTTASLLAYVLQTLGYKVNLVGNIGHALIESGVDYDYIVLEASSFQIYDGAIESDIAVITNLYEEHVDWHHGVDRYYRDKLTLLNRTKVPVLNADNHTLMTSVKTSDTALYFNQIKGFHVEANALMQGDKKLLKLDEIQLLGQHNLQNIAAVLTVCVHTGHDVSMCLEAIRAFKPLAHRLQNLGKIGQYYAINDSIATTPMATIAAMHTVDLSHTVLLVGGYDRGNNWQDFADLLMQKPPFYLVLSGQNSVAIKQRLDEKNASFDYDICANLTEAIKHARGVCPENGIILLSPGAPSFDQFDSYIHRGQFFEEQLKSYES